MIMIHKAIRVILATMIIIKVLVMIKAIKVMSYVLLI